MQNPRHELILTPRAVLRVTLAISAVLTLAHLLGLYLHLGLGHDYVYGFVPLFDLNQEQNAPTLYSSILLVSSGALCVFAGLTVTEWRWHWLFIALIFLVLGIDETFGLHEPLFFVLRGNQSEGTAALVANLNGLRWADLLPWMIVAAAILVGWYVSFIRHVGRQTTVIAIASASAYLLGAVGIDKLVSIESVENQGAAIVMALVTLEEVFELIGASLFVYTILRYLAEKRRFIVRLLP